MKIFIVIITFDGEKWLKKCLESIPKKYNIVIVDNNSSDNTVSFIKNNYPKVSILEQFENLGFGRANNIGISYALKKSADYIFLLNQDAYLHSNTIDELIEIHIKNKQFGVLSPIHLNGDGNKLDLNFSNYIQKNKELIFDALRNCYAKEIYELPFANAAAWLLPRETLETVGGFDPIFYHYGEDDNYCQRVLFHGLKIGVTPGVFINHDREFRINSQIHTDEDKLKLQERFYKSKWANINIGIDKDIKGKKFQIKKNIMKQFLKLKFNNALFYLKELSMVNRIVFEIYKSRKTNKDKGKHYIKTRS